MCFDRCSAVFRSLATIRDRKSLSTPVTAIQWMFRVFWDNVTVRTRSRSRSRAAAASGLRRAWPAAPGIIVDAAPVK